METTIPRTCSTTLPALLVLALLAPAGAARQDPAPPSGVVRLEIACAPEVEEDFQTALALLHSFFYEEARRRFLAIAERDPSCAMAWWGVAMTHYHPLWASPTPAEMAGGIEAVARAKELEAASDLERGLIEAIDAYFRSSDGPVDPAAVEMSCHGPRAHGARAAAFRDRLAALRERHPENLEVQVFYALSLLGTAPPADKDYRSQLLATSILEPLFERNPEHPGIAHYIIHAYDYPTLAVRGLVAARQYGEMAPWVPHALHMPSHIYTRLGMWPDSIEANLASAAAARDYTAEHHGGAVWYDELHALDYLVFAHLQQAQDEEAAEILRYVAGIERFHAPNFAAAYAIAAIPARCALERRRWDEAAELATLHPEVVAPFPFAEAHTAFARAVGGARSGRLDVARESIARLAELRDVLKEPKHEWWVRQVEIQRLAAAGWLARGTGDDAEAERLLRAAAALEDEAGTHPVTPGQILPAHEQLGDLLLELGRPAEARAEYELSLAAFPRRFWSLFGAAHAARLAGDREASRARYQELVQMAGEGGGRPEALAEARAALQGG